MIVTSRVQYQSPDARYRLGRPISFSFIFFFLLLVDYVVVRLGVCE